jgi:hypothetical protein
MEVRQAVLTAIHVLLDKEPTVSKEDRTVAALELLKSLDRADEQVRIREQIRERVEGQLAQSLSKDAAQA